MSHGMVIEFIQLIMVFLSIDPMNPKENIRSGSNKMLEMEEEIGIIKTSSSIKGKTDTFSDVKQVIAMSKISIKPSTKALSEEDYASDSSYLDVAQSGSLSLESNFLHYRHYRTGDVLLPFAECLDLTEMESSDSSESQPAFSPHYYPWNYTEAYQAFTIFATDITHIYTISWSGYPRVQGFLDRLISINSRLPGNTKLQRAGFFTGRRHSDMMSTSTAHPKILVVGELRDKIKIEVLARNMKRLGGNYTFESADFRSSILCPVVNCPVVAVITAKVAEESDFKKIQKLFDRFRKYHRQILYAIDTEPQISRENIKSELLKIGVHSAQESIVFDWQTTDELSKKISNRLEEHIISELKLLKQAFEKDERHGIILENCSRISFRRGIRRIKEAVNLLFIDNRLISDEILLGFIDREGPIQIDALKDRLLDCLLRVVQRKMENVLFSLIDIKQDFVTKLLDKMNFIQNCRHSIKDATLNALIRCIPPGVIGYPCEHLRDSNGRMEFLEMFTQMTRDNHGKLLMKDLSDIIRDAARRIITLELTKYYAIQEKLHFEVVSVLKRTIDKEIYEHLMPSVELPSVDLFAIDGVKGYGIIYNKLHVHIEKMDNDGDTKVRDKIKETLKGYPHPYKISEIVNEPVPLFCIGQKLFTSCLVNGVNTSYGTVGAFMKDENEELYILTSKHVVAFAADPSALCLANDGDLSDYASIGDAIYIPKCINMEDSMEQTTNLIDLAAVKIKEDQKERCMVHFKRPDETAGSCHIFRGPPEDICGLNVYKFGASTGKTHGTICSANYRYRDFKWLPDYCVLIEPEPGERNHRIFAREGDSGSTACALEEDDDATINVISMVTGGRLTVNDDSELQTEIVLTFCLQEGLKILPVKLSPCEYQE